MSARPEHAQALDLLIEWFDGSRSATDEEPKPYVICAGLAVLEKMRTSFPLTKNAYVTERNQVRTSGTLIRRILKRHGEERQFKSEGGRTTPGTVPVAERLAKKLNATTIFGGLSDERRTSIIDELQGWLVERVRDYLNRQQIVIEVDLTKPSLQIVADILTAAGSNAGAVAQHLVGAKLAVRFPDLEIENHSYTTADQPLGQPGDFVIGDTAFHITVSPMPAVLEKCQGNLRHAFRSMLLVPETKLQAARQMAETLNVANQVGIVPIELFVGQNIEEIGRFSRNELAKGFRKLLTKYNERVEHVEVNRALLIEIPSNL